MGFEMSHTTEKAVMRDVAALQDEALCDREAADVDALLEGVRAKRQARARRRARSFAVGIGSLVVAASIGFALLRPRALSFAVGEGRAGGELGARLLAAEAPTALHFSDGTEVVLARGAEARVVSTAPNGAHVVVERGEIHAAVVPREGGAWLVAVGPLDVHVKGTRFDASWDPKNETFRLKMLEGLVVVTGSCLPTPRASTAGEVLELSCPRDTTAHLPPAPAVIASAAASSTAPAPPPPAPPPPEPARARLAAPPVAEDARVPDVGWRAQLVRGDLTGAVAAAEATGWPEACASATAAELMDLGDAARATKRTARAEETYRAVRSRFPGTDAAALSAFHLGQMAFDQGGTLDDARRGFASYLAERPDGPLAQEALGRSMEVERRAGASATARARASDYLARFPDGPHALQARSLLTP